MLFYNTFGEVITLEEFVSLYNSIYYYQNSKETEDKIDLLLTKGFSITKDELISVLVWKCGGKTVGDCITTHYGSGKTISISDAKTILDEIDNLNTEFDDKLRLLYEYVLDKHVKNIGSTYILTLISVLSEGQYPIYDRFARKAITAITKECLFRESVHYVELPDKTDINGVLMKYREYIKLLVDVFGDRWKTERDIDRALWTYGHMF